MTIFVILLAATYTVLIASTAGLVPPVESQISPSSGQQNQNSVIYELQEAKIKIARLEFCDINTMSSSIPCSSKSSPVLDKDIYSMAFFMRTILSSPAIYYSTRSRKILKLVHSIAESILDESMPNLNAKIQYIRETEKKIEDISIEIDNLTTALSKLQHHSSRISALEEEVQLLWNAARKNNFEIHKLEFKAQDAEKRLDVLTSQVEKMAEVISEKWIQIQQLEQAVQMAEMRTQKVKRQLTFSKCPFVKFIKNHFGRHLETLKGILHPYGSYGAAYPNTYWAQALHHLQGAFSSAKQYHYKLQRFVKQEIERNEFPAALANEEVVFLVASALIVFPILSAFMFLFSHLS